MATPVAGRAVVARGRLAVMTIALREAVVRGARGPIAPVTSVVRSGTATGRGALGHLAAAPTGHSARGRTARRTDAEPTEATRRGLLAATGLGATIATIAAVRVGVATIAVRSVPRAMGVRSAGVTIVGHRAEGRAAPSRGDRTPATRVTTVGLAVTTVARVVTTVGPVVTIAAPAGTTATPSARTAIR
ncbi:hypothetical protein [Frondihabitans australicus]|uniref:Uncharacterized protein n=1 Tax=Frondihabitans australicus TaxID=386892 RepID=A0A495IH98_9MICO|nr:hypothetical protein [Frondihabitans australicus]RKR74456.1 hypothetical protein C8E83_1572 [Frondihabitans australicus]